MMMALAVVLRVLLKMLCELLYFQSLHLYKQP